MIGLINYGSGNIFAIANIYKRLNIPYVITREPSELKKAAKLILPGVGAYDETMQLLSSLNLVPVLNKLVLERRVPILGVCVGMQIMANNSEEGKMKGFGWIDAKVKKFDATQLSQKPHLPHLGWNSVVPENGSSLFKNIEPERGFYFLHSYYFSCNHAEDVLATTDYGLTFSSAVKSNNVYGVQFHPEKSHSNGIELFRNFANL
jgi:imidazole glycerol-phosphate synthase subunit HisH